MACYARSFTATAGVVVRWRNTVVVKGSPLQSSPTTTSAAAAACYWTGRSSNRIQLLLNQQQRRPAFVRHLCSTLSDDDGNRRTSTEKEQKEEQTNEKKRVVFLGTPDVAADVLHTLYEASEQPDACFTICAVVTQPAKRRTRKGAIEASAVGKAAQELCIPHIMAPEKANDPDFLDQLEHVIRPDLCITAAYGQYLPKRFLQTPVHGTVNLHPSLLPRWRGASPVQRSLQAGDNPLGVTVLYTVSKMDAGPVIAQESMYIDENDTATTVLPDLFQIGTKLLLDKLPDILSGKICLQNDSSVVVQDESQVVLAKRIDSSEAEFRVWEESAVTCHNRLRGFHMWPQAYLWLQVGDRAEAVKVKVTQTRVVAPDATTATAALTAVVAPTNVVQLGPTKQSGLYVVCFDGSVLELVTVQPATRKAFPARDFQNGYPGETIRWVKPPPSSLDAQRDVEASSSSSTDAPEALLR